MMMICDVEEKGNRESNGRGLVSTAQAQRHNPHGPTALPAGGPSLVANKVGGGLGCTPQRWKDDNWALDLLVPSIQGQ